MAGFFEHNVFGRIRAMIQWHKSDLSLGEIFLYTYIWKGNNYEKHLYINGDWKSVNTYKPLYAPYSEETLAEIAQGTEEDVQEAVTAAKNAMKK